MMHQILSIIVLGLKYYCLSEINNSTNIAFKISAILNEETLINFSFLSYLSLFYIFIFSLRNRYY